ncbi:MAG: hypothetical protein WD627_09240 [Actinomycetota bacterium]
MSEGRYESEAITEERAQHCLLKDESFQAILDVIHDPTALIDAGGVILHGFWQRPVV